MTGSIDPRTAETEADRGRLARQPRQVPYKGWGDVFWRVKDQIAADNVSIVAGGLALWSARRGMVALMTAMNVAYNEPERRGFFHQLALSLLFTLAGVVGFVLVVLLGLAVPVLVGLLPLGGAGEWVLLSVRWALLWVIAALALSALYRFAPNRQRARWHWVSWGSGIADTVGPRLGK